MSQDKIENKDDVQQDLSQAKGQIQSLNLSNETKDNGVAHINDLSGLVEQEPQQLKEAVNTDSQNQQDQKQSSTQGNEQSSWKQKAKDFIRKKLEAPEPSNEKDDDADIFRKVFDALHKKITDHIINKLGLNDDKKADQKQEAAPAPAMTAPDSGKTLNSVETKEDSIPAMPAKGENKSDVSSSPSAPNPPRLGGSNDE